MIKSNHKESHIQAVNERICKLLSEANINELYVVFSSQGLERETESIANLTTDDTTLLLMQALINNRTNYQYLSILEQLLEIKYNNIFLNPKNAEMCHAFVGLIYETTSDLVAKYWQHNQLKECINFLLQILRLLAYHKDEKSAQFGEYSFKSISHPDFLTKHLYKWCDVLFDFPFYLNLLSLVCGDPAISD